MYVDNPARCRDRPPGTKRGATIVRQHYGEQPAREGGGEPRAERVRDHDYNLHRLENRKNRPSYGDFGLSLRWIDDLDVLRHAKCVW